jgi:hypothetical protein
VALNLGAGRSPRRDPKAYSPACEKSIAAGGGGLVY